MNALILVDIQNDFCPSGALAVPNGHEVIEPANKLIQHFFKKGWLVVATQDWHPANHGSFASQHNEKPFTLGKLNGCDQMLWPDHCVQDSHGAKLHDDLIIPPTVFLKGCDPTVDSYSGFYDNNRKNDTGLMAFLKEHNVNNLYICGLATDYCVKFTALDAVKEFTTFLVLDACRGVNQPVGSVDESIRQMCWNKVIMTNSKTLIEVDLQ